MTERVTFDVKYYAEKDGKKTLSHSYQEAWIPSDVYCPICGGKRVLEEDGPGDYYVGPQHLCLACGAKFNLPVLVEASTDESDQQRLAALRGR